MEIIRHKMYKTIGIMLLATMLMSIAVPVFGATGKITLEKTSMEVTYESGKVVTIKVKENTTGEDVYWSSSKQSVVSNSDITGYTGSFFSKPRADLKLKGTGTTTITAKTKDGTVKASCTLNVKAKAADTNKGNNTGGSNGGVNTSGSGESLIGIGGTIIGGIFEVATSETTISAVTGFFTMIKDFLAGIIESILSSIRDVEMPSFEMPSTEQPKDESKKEVKTTGITVSPNTTTIDAGKSVNLTATFSPSNATDKEIKWESANTNIATVTQAGKVTAKENASGTVDIKAVLKSNNAVVGTCKVTVNAVDQGAGSGGGTIITQITTSSVVKTDAANAMPTLTREELLYIIENATITSTSNRRENLKAQLDNFMYIQNNNKVNALFAMAVAIQESGAGTSSAAINKNNWFGIMSGGTTKTYSSAGESIKAFGKLISGNTYFGSGKITPGTIGPVYCEGNTWSNAITSHMKSLYKTLNE